MSKINLREFEAACVDLILRGREEKVTQIIAAFNDADIQFDVLRKLVQSSPHSLGGMMLAFRAKDMQEMRLDFRVWPHSVLLTSANSVQNIEQFVLLLNAVEETVTWDDTFCCIQTLVENLTTQAIEDIVAQIDKLGLLRILVLTYIFDIVANRDIRYTFSSQTLLNQLRYELEQVKKQAVYFSLRVSWSRQSQGKKDIFPETFYLLSLFVVLKILPSQQFPEEYSVIQNTAYELFYRETDTLSRWDRHQNQFFWAYKQVLCAISDELVENWKNFMKQIEFNWAE